MISRIMAAAGLIAVLSGCSPSEPTMYVEQFWIQPLYTAQIAPKSGSLGRCRSMEMVAYVTLSDWARLKWDTRNVTAQTKWRSSDSSIASVSETGLVATTCEASTAKTVAIGATYEKADAIFTIFVP